ncbi:unnamed protein product [Cuscuta campestris]|uniref:Uncharacterized protein n=1 Tax=Cuscuta campestris TaxID=132261 RepID=A0A484LX24_9ASTE|nr:unnamed protein product [Cuscuta campestris]
MSLQLSKSGRPYNKSQYPFFSDDNFRSETHVCNFRSENEKRKNEEKSCKSSHLLALLLSKSLGFRSLGWPSPLSDLTKAHVFSMRIGYPNMWD